MQDYKDSNLKFWDSIVEQGIERARVEQEKRQQAVSEADTVTEAEPEEEPVEANALNYLLPEEKAL